MKLLSCKGGTVMLPDAKLVLVSREDGGNLIVNPPRDVWERSELTPGELRDWSFLVAATGRAMIDTLPQLEGGCVNYWEAGNWALNIDAAPKDVSKVAARHRRVHLHLLGRSRTATSESWRWGEAPLFPLFRDRYEWASKHERLTNEECARIATRTRDLLLSRYSFSDEDIEVDTPT